VTLSEHVVMLEEASGHGGAQEMVSGSDHPHVGRVEESLGVPNPYILMKEGEEKEFRVSRLHGEGEVGS